MTVNDILYFLFFVCFFFRFGAQKLRRKKIIQDFFLGKCQFLKKKLFFFFCPPGKKS